MNNTPDKAVTDAGISPRFSNLEKYVLDHWTETFEKMSDDLLISEEAIRRAYDRIIAKIEKGSGNWQVDTVVAAARRLGEAKTDAERFDALKNLCRPTSTFRKPSVATAKSHRAALAKVAARETPIAPLNPSVLAIAETVPTAPNNFARNITTARRTVEDSTAVLHNAEKHIVANELYKLRRFIGELGDERTALLEALKTAGVKLVQGDDLGARRVIVDAIAASLNAEASNLSIG